MLTQTHTRYISHVRVCMCPNFLCGVKDIEANINLDTHTHTHTQDTSLHFLCLWNRNCWQAYTLFRREIRQEQIACRTRAHTQFMQIYKYIFKLTISYSISYIFLGDMLLKFQFQQNYQQAAHKPTCFFRSSIVHFWIRRLN